MSCCKLGKTGMLKQSDGEREEGKRERDNPWCYGCSIGKNRIEDEGILTGSTLLFYMSSIDARIPPIVTLGCGCELSHICAPRHWYPRTTHEPPCSRAVSPTVPRERSLGPLLQLELLESCRSWGSCTACAMRQFQKQAWRESEREQESLKK